MIQLIKLNKVMWNYRAYDGTWCKMPYPNHPNGCPKFPECIEESQLLFHSPTELDWWAVVVEFDLKAHAEKMKAKHPNWTDRQCRCVLYWQGSVRKKLRELTQQFCDGVNGCCYTLCPEAIGVNVFGTMAKHGVILLKNPDLVRKIAFIGVERD